MSLTASFASVGRAVAYYPRLSKFFGSVNVSIFFSQLYYWQSRSSGDMGVFKTSEEWTEETGLSYREQATARKVLVDSGFLVETHKRLQHRVYYRLDLEAVDAAFEAWDKAQSPNDENAFREIPKAHSGDCAKRIPGDAENAVGGATKAQPVNKEKNTAEITAETTTYILPAAAPAAPLPPAAMAVVVAEPVAQPAAEKPPKPARRKAAQAPGDETELQTACRAAWTAYGEAYERRYGTRPIRNASVNARIKQFVQRIGHVESPDVARFFVDSVIDPFVLRKVHDVGLLLSGAEGYRTQWASGRVKAMPNRQEAQEQRNRAVASEWLKKQGEPA